jgi:hypothetical protein
MSGKYAAFLATALLSTTGMAADLPSFSKQLAIKWLFLSSFQHGALRSFFCASRHTQCHTQ